MISDVLLMWFAAFPLMGSPGPATLSLAATGAAYGSRAGLRYLMGIIAGTICVLVLIASGITGLVATQPAVVRLLGFAAAAYIVYLAFRIATARPLTKMRNHVRPPSWFGGFALAIVNPKAFAAIAAVYAGHKLVDGNLVLDALAKTGALASVVVIVNSAWLIFGSLISTVLHDPVKVRFTNIAFSIMLLASVASLMLMS